MTKMIRTAAGNLVDWDLIKIQTVASNNVAPKVEIQTQSDLRARRERRARLDAARVILKQAEQNQTSPTAMDESSDIDDSPNGWDDEIEDEVKGDKNA